MKLGEQRTRVTRKARHAEAKRRRRAWLLGEGPGRTPSVPAIFRGATRRRTELCPTSSSRSRAARPSPERPPNAGRARRRAEAGADSSARDATETRRVTFASPPDGRDPRRGTDRTRRARPGSNSGHGPCKSARRARGPRRGPTRTWAKRRTGAPRNGQVERACDIERADRRANSHFRTVRRAIEASAARRAFEHAVNGPTVDGVGG